MVSTTAPKFGVRFLTRKERTVRRVTKCETREIQKRKFNLKNIFIYLKKNIFLFIQGLEPPKPARVRPLPKPKEPKKKLPPATLCKPPKPPRVAAPRSTERHS